MNALRAGAETVAGWWVDWMVDMTWQLCLVVAGVLLAAWLLRKRSAALRHALWLLVLLRLVLPPSLAAPTGWGWWVREAPPPSLAAENWNRATAEGRRSSPAAQRLSLGLQLMAVWAAVSILLVARLGVAARQVQRVVARARPADEPLAELLEECRRRVARRRVELRLSDEIGSPLVTGIWRPVILLPAGLEARLSRAELRSVLVHELCHVARHDGAVNLLQGLLGALYFFHPLVWWANRRIRLLREEACDARTVAALGGQRKTYGQALVKVAELCLVPAPRFALGLLPRRNPLGERLRRILRPVEARPTRLPWAELAVVLVAVVLIPSGPQPAPAADAARTLRSPVLFGPEADARQEDRELIAKRGESEDAAADDRGMASPADPIERFPPGPGRTRLY